jgi:hypothetical protein
MFSSGQLTEHETTDIFISAGSNNGDIALIRELNEANG